MVDPITLRRWMFRLLYLAIALFVVFLRILPLDLSAGRWPGPDLLIVVAFAWVLRRPDYVPVLLVAGVLLAADMLFLRPPGLWTALGVIGLEFLRSREQLSRDLPFMFEWAMVAIVLLAMTIAYRVILLVFVVGQPSFGLSLIELFATVLSYPFVVVVSRWVFGVRKIAPGEVDQLGHAI
jgi:rod shape-determining protein MreD